MEVAAKGLLALLIAVTGALNDGLQALQEERFADAIASLTLVVDAQLPTSELPHEGRYYRAVAYASNEQPEKALADLSVLLTQAGLGEDLRTRSLALFQELGGKRADLLPEQPPEHVVAVLLEHMKRGEVEAVLARCTEPYRRYGMQPRSPQAWTRWMLQLLGNHEVKWVAIEFPLSGATARVVLDGAGGSSPWRLDLQQHGDEWKLANVAPLDLRNDPLGNYIKIKQLGERLRETNTGGIKLSAADRRHFAWIDLESGEQEPFAIRQGLRRGDLPDDTLLIAAPRPDQGKRLVLRLGGTIEEITEEEFVKQAREQGWQAPGLVKTGDLTEDQRADIRTLIEQLGAPDYAVRAEARRELIRRREAAEALLRERLSDPDPELRLTIREILEP